MQQPKQCDTSNKMITNSKKAGTLLLLIFECSLKLFDSKSIVAYEITELRELSRV